MKEGKNFRAASESRPKTGEIEVESESFTPPGVALATFRVTGRGGGGTGGEEEPSGSHSHVTTELNI